MLGISSKTSSEALKLQILLTPMYVCMLTCFGPVQLFSTLCTVTCQAPLVYGILQARILVWVAVTFSRVSSDSGIKRMSPVSHALQADSICDTGL